MVFDRGDRPTPELVRGQSAVGTGAARRRGLHRQPGDQQAQMAPVVAHAVLRGLGGMADADADLERGFGGVLGQRNPHLDPLAPEVPGEG